MFFLFFWRNREGGRKSCKLRKSDKKKAPSHFCGLYHDSAFVERTFDEEERTFPNREEEEEEEETYFSVVVVALVVLVTISHSISDPLIKYEI